MNSTTWIIEPNWVTWMLLAVVTISLAAIAIRLWTQKQSVQQIANQATNTSHLAWHNMERAITWVSFVLVLLCIAYIAVLGDYKDNVNNFSALGTIMGVLVTLLVGWSIYQVIETKDNLRDIVTLRSEFNALRSEIDILHQIHEAYVLSMEGEDIRREGHSSMAFEYHLNSAFLFMRDLEHYDMRFMHALSLMRVSFDDLIRPAMGPRNIEIDQFINRRDSYINQLEKLRNQARGITRFTEQAESEIASLVDDLRKLQSPNSNV